MVPNDVEVAVRFVDTEPKDDGAADRVGLYRVVRVLGDPVLE